MAQIENLMATTKEEVRKKVLTLYEDYRPRLEKALECVLQHSQIDFEQIPDNWQLPKEIVQALAKDMIRYHTNVYATKADKRRVKKFEETIIYRYLISF